MRSRITRLGRAAFACLVCASVLLVGCKSDSQPADQTAATTKAGSDSAKIPTTLEATDETWTPEAMEDLLAPIALYPDKILGDVLVAATNPQEIVDAANWRVKNDSLEAKALDTAAKQAGFTPPTRVLLQNSVALDMMASELGWTEEVGQAFVNDQEGVLEAVQRLRIQAKDAGNLKTSDKMEVVEGTTDDGQEVIELESPSPEVVYVPEYDAEAAYAPASEQVAATTTTTESSGDSGHSTGTVIAAGVIGFGAGLLLGKVFNDDDDEWYDDDYYQPNYYGRPMPYYPAYPYRPVYGNGYNQSTAYVRPANYRYAYNNNTTVNRNVNNNYWGRYDNTSYNKGKGRQVQSPITRANPKRNDVARLNDNAKNGPKRKGPDKAEREREQSVGRNTKRADNAGGDRAGGDGGGRDRADKGGGGDRGANKGGGGGGGGGGADRDRAKAGGGGGGKAGGGGGGGRAGGGGGGGKAKAGGGGGKAGGGGGGNKGGGGGRKRP